MALEFRGKLANQRVITIGSAPDNDFVIDHPTVSRHHATITRRRFVRRRKLSDLNSTNGTVVNGRRIDRPVVFRPDDSVRIGAVRLRLDSRGFNPASHLLLPALTLFCLFVVGFAASEYMLYGRAEHARSVASSASLSIGSIERSPDFPRWSHHTATNQVRTAVVRAISPARAAFSSGPPTSNTLTVPEWLARLNYYRSLAKVPPVAEDTSQSTAEVAHSRYLVMNYSAYFQVGSNPGLVMHTEDASKQWYSRAGLVAAKQSDLVEGCGLTPPESEAVDAWIKGAFHRLPLLNPDLRTVAYGFYQQPRRCWAAGLWLGPNAPAHSAHPKLPIEFPGDGSEVQVRIISPNEWPNLLTSCPGYAIPAGLPVSIQFGYGTSPRVTETNLSRDNQSVEHCLIDSKSYENPDGVTRTAGRRALMAFGAVVLLPRQPLLAASRYAVHITADGRSYDWQFSTR